MAGIQTVLIVVLISAIFQLSRQEVEFVSYPYLYYYLLPDTWVLIPCQAQQLDPDSTHNPLTLNATFFRNSSIINIYSPPAHHIVQLDPAGNVIALGVGAVGQDGHTTYHCEVGDLTSPSTTVFLGDGLPLSPVTPPVQLAKTLYSVTIAWGYVPTCYHHPLLGYEILFRSCDAPSSDAVVLESSSNKTELTLTDLGPGVSYCVSVGGWNSLGPGPMSPVVTVTSITALVPPSPSNITAITVGHVVTITWQAVTIDYDVMTPLQDYLIRYGASDSSPNLTATIGNTTTHFQVLIPDRSKDFQVGIASRNSVGHSDFTYTVVKAVSLSSSLSVKEQLLVLGTVAAVLVLFITLATCIILILCWKIRRLNSYKMTKQDSASFSSSELCTPQQRSSPNLYNPINPSFTNQLYLIEPNSPGTFCVTHTTFQ